MKFPEFTHSRIWRLFMFVFVFVSLSRIFPCYFFLFFCFGVVLTACLFNYFCIEAAEKWAEHWWIFAVLSFVTGQLDETEEWNRTNGTYYTWKLLANLKKGNSDKWRLNRERLKLLLYFKFFFPASFGRRGQSNKFNIRFLVTFTGSMHLKSEKDPVTIDLL